MTKIRQTNHNEVTVEFVNALGEKVVWEFFVPTNGGCVRRRTLDGSNPQVCARLDQTGTTLSANPETLLETIRREWRKRRQQGRYSIKQY